MLYGAEPNDRLVPWGRGQLASEALPWQPRTSEETDAERKRHYIEPSITSVLFCFLLIPHYSLIQAHVWGAMGTVTAQQAQAADTSKGGREKHTFKWEKNLAQCHLLILYSWGKLKCWCWQGQLFNSNCTITGHCIRVYVNTLFWISPLFSPLPVVLKCISHNTWPLCKGMSLQPTWTGYAKVISSDFCW